MAGIVWGQMGMYVLHLLFGIRLPLNFFDFCLGLFIKHSVYYMLILSLLNAWVTYSFLAIFMGGIMHSIRSKRFKARLSRLVNIELTNVISQRFELNRHQLIVIDQKDISAFTVGLRRPLIVVSTGLLTLLDPQELQAVMKHELSHQQHVDPLKLFILEQISRSLWFIPLAKWLYHNYKIICELAADEFAIRKTGSELGLSKALLKLINHCPRRMPSPVVVPFADTAVNYRLQHLLEPRYSIPLRLNTQSLLLSLFAMSMSALIVAVV
ncbi:hypothetical protein GCM10011391_07250 [Pullulanibacillus camelliae]|uniref:Peptidase M56 domain-containing protein n=2 Tax=Pullulanibacillus camelliae TaxID=1707096 RepID=A0A8J2VNN3_9BACL|nr:hypothetical protein GCM10011391_07250 [Pullulanibacillus camelliae]